MSATELSHNDSNGPQGNASRKGSPVWEFAANDDYNKTATCKLCSKTVKKTDWSTSGLRRHNVPIHNIPIANSISATENRKCLIRQKKELCNLVMNFILQDSRSFDVQE